MYSDELGCCDGLGATNIAYTSAPASVRRNVIGTSPLQRYFNSPVTVLATPRRLPTPVAPRLPLAPVRTTPTYRPTPVVAPVAPTPPLAMPSMSTAAAPTGGGPTSGGSVPSVDSIPLEEAPAASAGFNPMILLAVAAGAFFLFKKKGR